MSHPVILLADDHSVVRRGLKNILREHFSAATFLEAGTAQAALEAATTESCDLVVLDLSMPGGSGIEVLAEIHKRKPDLPILVMTAHSEEEYGIRVLRAGAAGFLMKESAPEELISAATKLLHRGRYVSPTLADRLAVNIQNPNSTAPHEQLSDREFEVLRMIAMGKSVTKIAEELHISDKTVSTYRTRILEKMGLASNAELMRYCLDRGLVR